MTVPPVPHATSAHLRPSAVAGRLRPRPDAHLFAARLPAAGGQPENPPSWPSSTLDGEPLSYLTQAAAQALRRLAARAVVVPVTTRTMAQYQRINLGFRACVRHRR